MPRRFLTLDVFTTSRFAGNPLAVVLDADNLDTGAMQTIAREFNLSETVFVRPSDDPAHRAKLRIFTPARELPFAGHPTVGTAVLLSIIDGQGASATGHLAAQSFVLEEQVGPIPCRVGLESADMGHAEFDLPKLPERESVKNDRAAMAHALGLTLHDVGGDAGSVEVWSAGNPFTFVPLASLDAVHQCRVDLATFDVAFRTSGRAAAFVFSRETTTHGHDIHARMFAPSFGILEDPATGSAVAAFAGYLSAHGRYSDGEHLVRVEQGYEMGRPSLIDLRIVLREGQLTAATIGGSAVIVSEGMLRT